MDSKKRQAREMALQVLFQREFDQKMNIESHLDVFRENFLVEKEVWAYAKKLVLGIIENLATIDKSIQTNSKNWNLTRMALVDKNILRIGSFEILHLQDQVPPRAAIDEAIEIAKKYSTTESPAFINGVLDQIFKSI